MDQLREEILTLKEKVYLHNGPAACFLYQWSLILLSLTFKSLKHQQQSFVSRLLKDMMEKFTKLSSEILEKFNKK